jgi:hypothetical protein
MKIGIMAVRREVCESANHVARRPLVAAISVDRASRRNGAARASHDSRRIGREPSADRTGDLHARIAIAPRSSAGESCGHIVESAFLPPRGGTRKGRHLPPRRIDRETEFPLLIWQSREAPRVHEILLRLENGCRERKRESRGLDDPDKIAKRGKKHALAMAKC